LADVGAYTTGKFTCPASCSAWLAIMGALGEPDNPFTASGGASFLPPISGQRMVRYGAPNSNYSMRDTVHQPNAIFKRSASILNCDAKLRLYRAAANQDS